MVNFLFSDFGVIGKKMVFISRKVIWNFLNLLFTSRFFVEFFKEHQALSNDSILTMGQYLSLPLIAVGLIFWIKSTKIDTN